MSNRGIMEQVTRYNNITQEVNMQVRINIRSHGAGHKIPKCHSGGQYTGQNCMSNRGSWSRPQDTTISHRRSTFRSAPKYRSEMSEG
jgi:hypothetical protein